VSVVPVRKDTNILKPSRRGHMSMAVCAAEPAFRAQAMADLLRDRYAPSTVGPRDSRWRTWCTIATSWRLPPIPLTPELIEKVGASLKHGRYRSSKLYFSVARAEHRRQCGNIGQDVEQAITDTIRSVQRGIGPAQLKDSFIIEQLRSFIVGYMAMSQELVSLHPWWISASPSQVFVMPGELCHKCARPATVSSACQTCSTLLCDLCRVSHHCTCRPMGWTQYFDNIQAKTDIVLLGCWWMTRRSNWAMPVWFIYK
jgi:hypothetical protein